MKIWKTEKNSVSFTMSFYQPSKINLGAKRCDASWRVNLVLYYLKNTWTEIICGFLYLCHLVNILLLVLAIGSWKHSEDILPLIYLKASYQITSNSEEVSVIDPLLTQYTPFWTILNPLSYKSLLFKVHKFLLQECISCCLKIYEMGTNVRCFTFSLFHWKTPFSNSTCHFLTVIQPWSVRSEYLLGFMSVFSTKKGLHNFESALKRSFFNELIKAQLPSSFMDFIHLQASCPGTQTFWR